METADDPEDSYLITGSNNERIRLIGVKKRLFSSQEDISKAQSDGLIPLAALEMDYFSKNSTCSGSGTGSEYNYDSPESDILSPAMDRKAIASCRLESKLNASPSINTRTKYAEMKTLDENSNDSELDGKDKGIEEPFNNLFQRSLNLNIFDFDGINSEKRTECNNNDNSKKRAAEPLHNHSELKKRRSSSDEPTDDVAVPKMPCIETQASSPKLPVIPTKSFYSHESPDTYTRFKPRISPTNNSLPKVATRGHSKPSRIKKTINKGVWHKIRRRPNASIVSQITDILSMDNIINNLRNEKLRNLLSNKREDRLKIERLYEILRNNENPIALSRPLNVLDTNEITTIAPNTPFTSSNLHSDAMDDQLDTNSNVCHDDMPSTSNQSRKFFKTSVANRSTKEIRLVNNRTAYWNGKIYMKPDDKCNSSALKLPFKDTSLVDFSHEQAEVDKILKQLEFSPMKNENNENNKMNNEIKEINDYYSDVDKEGKYHNFYKRIPYNTDDEKKVERQRMLLKFLIFNGICTEKNFEIFIANLEGRQMDAAAIIDEVVTVIEDQPDMRERIPYQTDDPATIRKQHSILDFLLEHGICNDETFDIFIANHESRRDEAEAIFSAVINANKENVRSCKPLVVAQDNSSESYKPKCKVINRHITKAELKHALLSANGCNDVIARYMLPRLGQHKSSIDDNTQPQQPQPKNLYPIFYPINWRRLEREITKKPLRTWTGGLGANQYQIDAGQRNFGPKYCKGCGMLYTLHEPEEEKLHVNYHQSLTMLTFQGWENETVVSRQPEWSSDGRIIRVHDGSRMYQLARIDQVMDIINNELGVATYNYPEKFVAYLAIKNKEIIGICLVEPLEKANKYICIENVDCCTEEQFDTRCGVSRIWVAPLHRQRHVAMKLIHAVQVHTVTGDFIPINQIAFSVPTAVGKNFAKNIAKTENFLLYQPSLM